MTAIQLPLDLGYGIRRGDEDFLRAPGNETAYRGLAAWPDWSQATAILCGPTGAGKTHLATIWAHRIGARRIDPARLAVPQLADLVVDTPALWLDPVPPVFDETALFHLLNLVAEQGRRLLLVAETAPARWQVQLPDLRSRLLACPVFSLAAPDDLVLRAVLVKLFADRQLTVGPDLIDYITARVERSFAALRHIVAALDQAALASGCGVTIALARLVLADQAGQSGDLADEDSR